MSTMHDMELLQAALTLAAADGKITRSERGVIDSLAKRAGVGQASLEAMIAKALNNPHAQDELLQMVRQDVERPLRLLVATARIDGHISPEERELIVALATRLGITGADFQRVYEEGIAAADKVRERGTGGNA